MLPNKEDIFPAGMNRTCPERFLSLQGVSISGLPRPFFTPLTLFLNPLHYILTPPPSVALNKMHQQHPLLLYTSFKNNVGRGETIHSVRFMGDVGRILYVHVPAAGLDLKVARTLYRLDATASGAPSVTWREEYPNSGVQKPGQVSPGSGTTPTHASPETAVTPGSPPWEDTPHPTDAEREYLQQHGVRMLAAEVDPTIRLTDVQPLGQVSGGEAQMNWALTSVAWLVSFIVLLLSATGIHALMSFTVTRRRREIGIRAALGAELGVDVPDNWPPDLYGEEFEQAYRICFIDCAFDGCDHGHVKVRVLAGATAHT